MGSLWKMWHLGLSLEERPDVRVRWTGRVSTGVKTLEQCPDSRTFVGTHVIAQWKQNPIPLQAYVPRE